LGGGLLAGCQGHGGEFRLFGGAGPEVLRFGMKAWNFWVRSWVFWCGVSMTIFLAWMWYRSTIVEDGFVVSLGSEVMGFASGSGRIYGGYVGTGTGGLPALQYTLVHLNGWAPPPIGFHGGLGIYRGWAIVVPYWAVVVISCAAWCSFLGWIGRRRRLGGAPDFEGGCGASRGE
jgi:hypothetical protein